MTPKERVLQRWPRADWAGGFGFFVIYRNADKPQNGHNDMKTLGSGNTIAAAWADAAKRLRAIRTRRA